MNDLNDIKYWLFDLDNTLYDGATKVFEQVDKKMTKFISEKLNVNNEEARKIHYGEEEEKPIYGEATEKESKELVEEGISLVKLPFETKEKRKKKN